MRRRLGTAAICHRRIGYIYRSHVHEKLAFSSIINLYHQPKIAPHHSIKKMMCSIFILALLYLLSSAIPLLPPQPNQTSPFVLQAFRPGSPIHLSSMNAHDGHFWLGKTTSSSCPLDLKLPCRTGTKTALVVSDNGYATLVNTHPPALPLTYLMIPHILTFPQ